MSKITQNIYTNRTALIEVIVAAIFIGISVSIIASHLYSQNSGNENKVVIGAIFVLAACILALSRKLGNSRYVELSIRSFLTCDKGGESILDVPRYEYHEGLKRYFRGAFEENSALKAQWDKEPMGSGFKFDLKTGKVTFKTSASSKLVKEATEYFVLDKLSSHLTDYFNTPMYPASMLKALSREDIPDILLSNRFMEMFTKSMEDRELFREHEAGDRTIIMASSRGGALYHRFDLTLPVHSKVYRKSSDDSIVIETQNFELFIKVDSSECSHNLPRGFEQYYLGKKFDETSTFAVKLDISVQFKLMSVLRNNNSDYHEWLDSFLQKLDNSMSYKKFFDEINWSLAYTMIQCGEKSKKKGHSDQKNA